MSKSHSRAPSPRYITIDPTLPSSMDNNSPSIRRVRAPSNYQSRHQSAADVAEAGSGSGSDGTRMRSRATSMDVLLNVVTPNKLKVKPFVFSSAKHRSSSRYSLLQQWHSLTSWQRKLLIALAVLLTVTTLTYTIVSRVILYLSTGSLLYHDYSWYSINAAAVRLYGTMFQPMTDSGGIPQLTPAALAQRNESGGVCYNVDSKFNVLTANHVQIPADSIVHSIHTYVIVQPVDFDLFPYLWDTILLQDIYAPYSSDGSALQIVDVADNTRWKYNIDRCNTLVTDFDTSDEPLPPYCYRTVRHNNILYTFQVITLTMPPAILRNIKRVLFVGDVMEYRTFDALAERYDFYDVAKPAQLSIGLISLSDEGCHNWQYVPDTLDWPTARIHPVLGQYTSLLAHPYGDCIAEQVVPLYLHWPLGPATRHSFPSYLHPSNSKPIAERSVLLNMQVSYNPTKPTRMQAWFVTSDYCNSLSGHPQYNDMSCYIHNNDLLFKIAQGIDSRLGTSLHMYYPFADPVATEYLPLLHDSRFTICPAGKNPYEQYRVYEALMAGSIPIIEAINLDKVPLHPYGITFRCRPDDAFYLFTKLKAPVLYVSQWSELPALLDSITDEDAQAMQTQLIEWYDTFGIHLRDSLLEKVAQM